jgi:8-oxo-dGTP pyrophosphatase MutT (NUDIX family)
VLIEKIRRIKPKKIVKAMILKGPGRFPPFAKLIRFGYHTFMDTNSGAFGIVRDEAGRILAHELWDGGLNMPGGTIKKMGFLGLWGSPEDAENTVVREVKEETGLTVEIVRISESAYRKYIPGDRGGYFHLFNTKTTGGELTMNEETRSFKWLSKEDFEQNPQQIRGGKYSPMWHLFSLALYDC